MTKTFAKLATYMEANRSHEIVKGRETAYTVIDTMKKGQNIRQTMDQIDAMDVDGETEWINLGDEMEVVEDDGGLDTI